MYFIPFFVTVNEEVYFDVALCSSSNIAIEGKSDLHKKNQLIPQIIAKRLPAIRSMLIYCLRRWSNITSAFGKRWVRHNAELKLSS